MTTDQLNAAQEIVSKLQAACDYPRTFASPVVRNLCIESKNLIEQLLAECQRMREALDDIKQASIHTEACRNYGSIDGCVACMAKDALEEIEK